MKSPSQFMLRVKTGSEMDSILRAMYESDVPLSAEDLRDIGGLSRSAGLARRLPLWFDNVSVNLERGDPEKRVRLNYVNVLPSNPIPVGIDVNVNNNGNGSGNSDDNSQESDMRWSMAPPIIDSMGSKFREPTWFNAMAIMVKNGSNISLAGPPGVGKDTAVQELAAQEGKVLVTVGGDAGFRRRDLVGSSQIVNGRSYMNVAEYASAVVNGWWVLMTEVNAADADALMFLNTQLAPPYVINIDGKSYPVHPDFRLFVTYNAGLIGTKPLPQSFKDRFFSIEIPFPSDYQLTRILVAHGMSEDDSWSKHIVAYGSRLWSAHVRGALRYQITTRRLMDAVRLMNLGITTSVVEALKMSVLSAIDSPVEKSVAERVLNEMNIMEDFNG